MTLFKVTRFYLEKIIDFFGFSLIGKKKLVFPGNHRKVACFIYFKIDYWRNIVNIK